MASSAAILGPELALASQARTKGGAAKIRPEPASRSSAFDELSRKFDAFALVQNVVSGGGRECMSRSVSARHVDGTKFRPNPCKETHFATVTSV